MIPSRVSSLAAESETNAAKAKSIEIKNTPEGGEEEVTEAPAEETTEETPAAEATEETPAAESTDEPQA